MADTTSPLPVTLRLATLGDAPFLLALRNEPSVRAMSSNAREIQLDEHCEWIAQQLALFHTGDTRWGLYVAEVQGTPVGMGRIYRRNTDAYGWRGEFSTGCMLSYSLLPQYRGKGYGRQLVAMLVKLAQDKGHSTIGCRIKRDNWRSLKVAIMNGVNSIEVFT